jgi:hypothetical protein
MATLETQYKNYLIVNPESKFTFEEWMEKVWTPALFNSSQMGDDNLSDWDVTLMDGLEDEG